MSVQAICIYIRAFCVFSSLAFISNIPNRLGISVSQPLKSKYYATILTSRYPELSFQRHLYKSGPYTPVNMCIALAYMMKRKSDQKGAAAEPNMRPVDSSHRPASPTSKLPGGPNPPTTSTQPQYGQRSERVR